MVSQGMREVKFSLAEFVIVAQKLNPIVGALAEMVLYYTPQGVNGDFNHMSATLRRWEYLLLAAFEEVSKEPFSEFEKDVKRLWIKPQVEEWIN